MFYFYVEQFFQKLWLVVDLGRISGHLSRPDFIYTDDCVYRVRRNIWSIYDRLLLLVIYTGTHHIIIKNTSHSGCGGLIPCLVLSLQLWLISCHYCWCVVRFFKSQLRIFMSYYDRRSSAYDWRSLTNDWRSSTYDRLSSTDDRRTTTDDRPPTTEGRRPTIVDRQSPIDDRPPTTDGRRPMIVDRRLTTDDRRPIISLFCCHDASMQDSDSNI